jgi:hypothetical protein
LLIERADELLSEDDTFETVDLEIGSYNRQGIGPWTHLAGAAQRVVRVHRLSNELNWRCGIEYMCIW